MLRFLGPLMALGLLAGCVTDGNNGPYGGGDPGIRWSGPYGGPYARSFPGSPFYRSYDRDEDDGRFVRRGGGVVCDRATATCYRDRELDVSETRDFFGRRAARQADRVRDAAGTNHVFRADDDVVCNRREKVCYKDGHPDRSETRDFFGKKAARRMGD
jgi:hypothetical protein